MATPSQARSSSPDDSRSRDRRRVGDYTLGDTLGAGSFGKVKLATHVTTGEKVCPRIPFEFQCLSYIQFVHVQITGCDQDRVERDDRRR
jgi:serine/threonine protein kinase